ncbi:hypothetical protein JCM21900_003932 [Sporobolomyces salmonicolor]
MSHPPPPPSLAMNSPTTSYPPIAPAPPSSSSQPIPIASVSTPSSIPAVVAPSPTPSTSAPTHSGPPPKKKRRSKVESACRFCRKSHMACDGQRPCARCIKREIAHLCNDEPIAPPASNAGSTRDSSPAAALIPATSSPPAPLVPSAAQQQQQPILAGLAGGGEGNNSMLNTLGLDIGAALGAGNPLAGIQGSLFGAAQPQQQQQAAYGDFNMALLDLANDGLGAGLGLDMTATGDGEFHGLGLSEFLQSLNDAPFLGTPDAGAGPAGAQIGGLPINHDTGLSAPVPDGKDKDKSRSVGPSVPGSPINKTERFLLTAADQKDGSRSDRLARVIHAKFEAGLLRPYNHVAGYTRLMKWMADNMSASSRQRTLHTLSEFRPTFRAIASGLTDLDLVFIEEAFERLLLDYDRVFSSMGIPSCLWRRTGEIYKGNKEFAALVGVPIENLQGGKLAIYELMAEESAVNYWEKYGNIAFDVGQKAVLTSCVLINQSILSRKRKRSGDHKSKVPEDAMVSAAFSFTIRRDSYGIPSMIVGNFLKL